MRYPKTQCHRGKRRAKRTSRQTKVLLSQNCPPRHRPCPNRPRFQHLPPTRRLSRSNGEKKFYGSVQRARSRAEIACIIVAARNHFVQLKVLETSREHVRCVSPRRICNAA